jgi:DNA polymerase-3 subunit alpha
MKLCIKTSSDSAALKPELVELCSKYSGTTAVCYYLTDLKKTVAPRSKLSLKVNREVFEKLKSIYELPQIGLI